METGMKVKVSYKGCDLLVEFVSQHSVEIYSANSNRHCREFNQLERATIMGLAVEEMEFLEFKNRKVA